MPDGPSIHICCTRCHAEFWTYPPITTALGPLWFGCLDCVLSATLDDPYSGT